MEYQEALFSHRSSAKFQLFTEISFIFSHDCVTLRMAISVKIKILLNGNVVLLETIGNCVQTFIFSRGWLWGSPDTSPHLWFWVKCHNNYWRSCLEIWLTHSCSHAFRMNCDNCGDTLTFHLAPIPGQNVNLSNTLVYGQEQWHSYQPQMSLVISGN